MGKGFMLKALTALVLLDLSALVTITALTGRINALTLSLAFSAWMLTRLANTTQQTKDLSHE